MFRHSRVYGFGYQYPAGFIVFFSPVIVFSNLELSRYFDIALPPSYPTSPPTTPPIKAPRKGRGIRDCPTKAPKIPEPTELAVSMVRFPSS